MSRRRRALLLLALALALGTLAGADVARREAALREGVGPSVRVLVAARDLPAGAALTPARLARRTVPARFAPAGAFTDPVEVAGLRTAAPIARGVDVTTAAVDAGRPPGDLGLRPGERAAQLVAAAPAGAVGPGARVDVLAVGDGGARLLLQDAEVLAAAPADPGARDALPRVAVVLRATLGQAVALAGAEAAARQVRLLPRPSATRPGAP